MSVLLFLPEMIDLSQINGSIYTIEAAMKACTKVAVYSCTIKYEPDKA
jgi:hypothetical protein